MSKSFKYHPIIEGLKVNEDGSEIRLNDVILPIKTYQQATSLRLAKLTRVGKKSVSTIRLVCECWLGVAPTGEHAARRKDEEGGDHYTNLYWGKIGMNESSAKSVNSQRIKLTREQFFEIEKRRTKELLKNILQEYAVSKWSYHRAKARYNGEEK